MNSTNSKTFAFKPSFEIDFWLKHFKGFDDNESRAYEAFCEQPIAEMMFFADTDEDMTDDLSYSVTDILKLFCKDKRNKNVEYIEIEYIEIDQD